MAAILNHPKRPDKLHLTVAANEALMDDFDPGREKLEGYIKAAKASKADGTWTADEREKLPEWEIQLEHTLELLAEKKANEEAYENRKKLLREREQQVRAYLQPPFLLLYQPHV